MDLPAEHYQKHSSLQFGLAQEALNLITIQENFAILDVGCGDGKLTAQMAMASQGKTIGIDSSPNMINLAKKTFPFVEFMCVPAEALAFDQQFNLVTSFSCLHWIRNPEKALQNIVRSVKDNGEILILTYLKSAYSQCLEKALSYFPDYIPLSAYRHTRSLEEYGIILENEGASIQVLESQELIAHYPSQEALINYIRGWLVSYVPLPEVYQEEYLKKVAEVSIIYADLLQGYYIPYKTGIIKAKK